MTPDLINGLFELVGGALVWISVLALYRDKQVKGVYVPAWAFFAAWGMWNLYYYPALEQWWSFAGGMLIAAGNLTWVLMAVYYGRKDKEPIPPGATNDGICAKMVHCSNDNEGQCSDAHVFRYNVLILDRPDDSLGWTKGLFDAAGTDARQRRDDYRRHYGHD